MRFISTLILCLWISNAFSQHVDVVGPTRVEPGMITSYVAPNIVLHPLSIVTWTASGGTVVSQTQTGCEVQWDHGTTVGFVSVDEDLHGQSGSLGVQIGNPTITPEYQLVNYGSNVWLCVNQVGATDYLWQFSPDATNWSDIGGQGNGCYELNNITTSGYYRCLVWYEASNYYTNAAFVGLAPLNAGSIALVQQPAYNTNANITNVAASGGSCNVAAFQYAWEQSVEGGPWTVFGNTAAYPSNAPVIGYTRVRRRVTCNGETVFTNTLDLTPAYTGVDFENRNYIRVNTIATRGIQSWYQADQLEAGKKFQQTVYFDGLGRAIQTVDKGISPAANDTWKDMVSFTEYDKLGRPVFNNLPYPTANEPGKFKTSTSEQTTFYTVNFNETNPWGKTEYETDNPLGRVKKSIDPGAYRLNNGIGTSFKYDFNNSNSTDEKVHIWRIGYHTDAIPVTAVNDIYQTGTLAKIVTTDAGGKIIIEYKDFEGNVVLKKVKLSGITNEHDGWLCTYYVYDDFNRLRFIITPKAVKYLDTHNWVLTQAIADELCFYYQYDRRGRPIIKKTPGAAKLSLVYDQRDRLVYTQDGNQFNKTAKEWIVYFYDELDRVVLTGIYKSNKTRNELQTDLNTTGATSTITIPAQPIDPTLTIWERPVSGGTTRYVASQSIEFIPEFTSHDGDEFVAEIDPTVSGSSRIITVVSAALPAVDVNNPATFTALFYRYYDDYNYAGAKPFDNNYNNLQAYAASEPDIEPISKTNRTRGGGRQARKLGYWAPILF